MTKIAWTDETWNPVTGCTKVSEGCAHCYAEGIAKRFWKGRPFTDVQCHYERLDIPFRWKKDRMVFVCSMGDLFHDDVPDDFVGKVLFPVHTLTCHKWQILTKRPKRMAEYFTKHDPPKEAWLGVTAENQKRADERIPILLQIPAAVRFVSLEPLLSYVNIQGCLNPSPTGEDDSKLDWVIVGCESGPKRRECKLEWVRSIVEQCADAGVPCFVKQIEINGRVSHNPAEWPEDLRVQQKPEVRDGEGVDERSMSIFKFSLFY